MKFTADELKQLLNASYDNKKYDIERFIIDKELSSGRVKAYTLNDSDDVIVVHRGSNDFKDWADNRTWLRLNLIEKSQTYKIHLERHMKIVNKYGADKITVMGHSRGGLYASLLYKKKLAKQVINYNKPVNLYDISKNLIYNQPQDENSTIIRTSRDLASIGQKLLKPNDTDITIQSQTINPLNEHGIDRLDDYEGELIGNGIFKPQINYCKIRKPQLKKFVKDNKKKFHLDINITGLTKPELIELSEYIIYLSKQNSP